MHPNNLNFPNQPPLASLQTPQQQQTRLFQQQQQQSQPSSTTEQPGYAVPSIISAPSSLIGNSLRASSLLMAQTDDSHPLLFPAVETKQHMGQERGSTMEHPSSMRISIERVEFPNTPYTHDGQSLPSHLAQHHCEHFSQTRTHAFERQPFSSSSSMQQQFLSPPTTSTSGSDGASSTNVLPPNQYLASNFMMRESSHQTQTNSTNLQTYEHPCAQLFKADTSCLLCKIRHRKCDYLFPCCSNCAKENRSFCLYMKKQSQISQSSSPMMSSSEFLLSDTEAESISSLLPKENIESIYKTIYNNISSLKSSPEITSKLSYEIFLKIILKVLPSTDREQILQFMKVSLFPQTEKFVGSLEYFYKYFHDLGENDCSFIWTCQAMCFQRIDNFALAKMQYEKARSRMAIVFDNVSDFKTMLTYSWLAIYLIGRFILMDIVITLKFIISFLDEHCQY